MSPDYTALALAYSLTLCKYALKNSNRHEQSNEGAYLKLKEDSEVRITQTEDCFF
jgi:hypothetical protein